MLQGVVKIKRLQGEAKTVVFVAINRTLKDVSGIADPTKETLGRH